MDKLITLKGAKLITLWRPKGGQTNNSPAYVYIYIYIWPTPHFMGRYTPFLAFFAQFYSKNAPILQPTNCGCKFVFLFSSFSLLLPFSALFFFFLCFYQSQSLKIAHQLRCAAIWPTYMAIWLHIYICCEIIIWAKFGHFRCYYLGQVGVIIRAKLFLAYTNSGFKRFLAHTVSILCFFGAQLSGNYLKIAFFSKKGCKNRVFQLSVF